LKTKSILSRLHGLIFGYMARTGLLLCIGEPDDDLLPDERAFLTGKADPAPAGEAAAAGAADDGAAEGDKAAETGDKEPDAEAAAVTGADGGEAELDAEALAAVANDATPAPTTYEVPDLEALKTERASLAAKTSDIDKRWTDGSLTDDERAAELAKISERADELLRQVTRAETIAELNRQNQAREQGAVLTSIAQASAKAGLIDYSDAKNGVAFDGMLRAVSADPSNEGKTFAEIAQMAHDALCAVRGLKAAAPAPTPAPAPATSKAAPAPAKDPREGLPTTLHGMPAAGAPPVGNDFLTSLAASDDPDAAEAALEALPKAQRAALLRQTVNTGQR
jgi:hypothetical protein